MPLKQMYDYSETSTLDHWKRGMQQTVQVNLKEGQGLTSNTVWYTDLCDEKNPSTTDQSACNKSQFLL
jgi:hypothetical protein